MKKYLRNITLAAGLVSATGSTACNNPRVDNQDDQVLEVELDQNANLPSTSIVAEIQNTVSGQVVPEIETYDSRIRQYRSELLERLEIRDDQIVTILEDHDLPEEVQNLALDILRDAPDFATLDQDNLIRLSVYAPKINWINNWRTATRNPQLPVNRFVDTSEMVESYHNNAESFAVGQQRFVNVVTNATHEMRAHFPVEHLTESLRQFLRFNPEMVIALTSQEHSDPSYVASRNPHRDNVRSLRPEQRIELLRLYLNSGFNPFYVVPNSGSNLPFGVLQNTPSSTSFSDLSLIWGSRNFTGVRDPNLVNPFLDREFSEMFEANEESYKLQIMAALTKILNRLQLESQSANESDQRQNYLEFVEALRNRDRSETDRLGVVMAAIVQASSTRTSRQIIGPVVVSGARSAQEAIDMILSSDTLISNEELNRYVRHALETYDLLKSGETGFGVIE